MNSSQNFTTLLNDIHIIYTMCEGGVIGMSVFVSVFWIVYLYSELINIKKRYKRALNDVRDFEADNIINDLKSRLVKNLILLFICSFEIIAPILAFSTRFIPNEYKLLAYYYTITSVYLTFCLLNILTTYLIRVYTCKPDSKKDRRALIIFFIKLVLTILLSLLFYIIILPSLLVIFLFIVEFLCFIKNGRMLDRVIGWKQQDLSLEFGSEGRVLAIKRMRRRFNLFNTVFITCSSSLLYLLPMNLVNRYFSLMIKSTSSQSIVYIYHIELAGSEALLKMFEYIMDVLTSPVIILALFYILFTIRHICSPAFEIIHKQLKHSLRRLSNHSNRRPLLLP